LGFFASIQLEKQVAGNLCPQPCIVGAYRRSNGAWGNSNTASCTKHLL